MELAADYWSLASAFITTYWALGVELGTTHWSQIWPIALTATTVTLAFTRPDHVEFTTSEDAGFLRNNFAFGVVASLATLIFSTIKSIIWLPILIVAWALTLVLNIASAPFRWSNVKLDKAINKIHGTRAARDFIRKTTTQQPSPNTKLIARNKAIEGEVVEEAELVKPR